MQTYTMCLEHSMLKEVFLQRSKQKKRAERLANAELCCSEQAMVMNFNFKGKVGHVTQIRESENLPEGLL